jgi:uncharacterized protein (TIGR03663 family)
MKWPKKCWVLILVVTIVAVALRLPSLDRRPMHGDEAVNAVKFGSLLEEGFYRYDSHEYHGPTLNYLTLIPAWLSGVHEFQDVDEFILRIVPVFFGVLIVLMTLLLVDGLGWAAVIATMALAAVSPAFVFYSRYYIHEMLLVCSTFGVIVCGYRYTQSKTIKWALLAGVFLGLMHATKETCIIAFGSMLLALLVTIVMQPKHEGLIASIKEKIKLRHLVAALATAVIVSVLFYSSFFSNPKGIADSVLAYTTYCQRAYQNQLHIHPWYYYLDILTWMEGFEKLTWNEDIIVVLAGLGFIFAVANKLSLPLNRSLLRFIAFYTLTMIIVYSAIPYKTPWSMLGFLHGMILLAGVAVAVLIKLSIDRWQKLLLGIVLVLCFIVQPVQAYFSTYRYCADTSNPYVYAHPVTDVFQIAERIEQIAQVHPAGRNMYIQVICPEDDYWPLPWYLRGFASVGWWSQVDEDVPSAPIIIASPSVEPALLKKLYELPAPGEKNLYVPLFDSYMELRPQVELRGFVTKDLWDSYRQHQSPSILTEADR